MDRVRSSRRRLRPEAALTGLGLREAATGLRTIAVRKAETGAARDQEADLRGDSKVIPGRPGAGPPSGSASGPPTSSVRG